MNLTLDSQIRLSGIPGIRSAPDLQIERAESSCEIQESYSVLPPKFKST